MSSEDFQRFLEDRNETPTSNGSQPMSETPAESANRSRLTVEQLHRLTGRARLKWLVPGGEPEEGREVTWFKLDKAITDNILGNIESNLPREPCPMFRDFPEDVNESWWKSFAQKFNWDEAHKGEIKKKWEQLAASQYSHHMNVWKKAWLDGKDKPRRLPQTHWEYFQGYWQLDETKKKSNTAKRNRCGTNEKPVGTHNNGACTFERTEKEMTRKANGVRPDHLTLMKVTHTSKKTGEIENKKIKQVINKADEMIESRMTELAQQGTPVSSLYVEEINKIVYEATDKSKGRTLGLGSVPKTQALSVASSSSNRELQNKILELQEADAAKEAEIQKLRSQMEAEAAKRDELLDWLRTKHGYPN